MPSGKPLIQWTIEAAKKSLYVDEIVLSSDDVDIINIDRQAGCPVPFVRPSCLAQDNSPVVDVISLDVAWDHPAYPMSWITYTLSILIMRWTFTLRIPYWK